MQRMERPTTIAEMLDATVARRGDQPAIGVFNRVNGRRQLNWLSWADIGKTVRGHADELGGPFAVADLRCRFAFDFARADLAVRYRSGVTVSDAPLPFATHFTEGFDLKAWAMFMPTDHPPPVRNFDPEIAALQPTSGTSGDPRIVALSHENLVSNTIAVAETIAASLGEEDDGEEVRLSFLAVSSPLRAGV